uniref:E3 ubiquitin-protein ligase synoviolin-like TPR repeats domain-containing protein n=1 Tax=Bubo bubo TaxID=30461 RepID=A0A8C0FQF0_BUBBB
MLCTAAVMAGSLALTTAVVAHAYYLKHQFYPTVVYLTKSSPSMAVLYIQAFVLVFLLGKFMGKVFFGQLRAAEMELDQTSPARTKGSSPRSSSPQYAILITMVLTIFIKYVLHSIDLQNENPWDSKAVYMLYTELFTGTSSLFHLFFPPNFRGGVGFTHPGVAR